MGLRINEGRPKYMEVTTWPTDQNMFKAMNFESECGHEFKYLGTLVTNNNRITAEINHRIGISNRYYHRLKDMLISRYLKGEIRDKLCNGILKPVLVHGSKGWTLAKGDE
jgi:hypothetical protein